jgi:hypothetical protein
VGFLGYSKGFFVNPHILFRYMLEIKVHLIIVSKVFGVNITVNFIFAIVKYMFSNCKRVVAIEKMELGSFGGKGEQM